MIKLYLKNLRFSLAFFFAAFALVLFSNKANAQGPTVVYFEDFRAYSDFDLTGYAPLGYDNNLLTLPDGGLWSAVTGADSSCGYPTSKWFGSKTTIIGTGNNGVFLGKNVGTCLSTWIAPDQNFDSSNFGGYSADIVPVLSPSYHGWITVTPFSDITLSASYGRSSNMTTGMFMKFQYETNDQIGTLHDWDPTLDLSSAFTPSTGTIFCKVPSGVFSGIRLYVSMYNLDNTTPEYHWFDNVKVEQCDAAQTNLTFSNPILTYPTPPTGCTAGCDTTTLKFTQTMPYTATCENRMDSGTTLYINLPSNYNALGCTGVLLTASTYSNTGLGGDDVGSIVGQSFTYVIGTYTPTTNQVSFTLPTTIYGGTDVTSAGNAVRYDGTTFSIYLYGIKLDNSLPNSNITITNFSGGTNSATYIPAGYSCTVASSFSLNTGSPTQFYDSLTSHTGCGTSTYYFFQRTTTGSDCRAQINVGSTFTVTFPIGTDLSTVSSGCINIGTAYPPACTYSITGILYSANVLTFTSPVTIPVNTQFFITLNGVGNGNNLSNAAASVSVTNQGGGVDSSASYRINYTTPCVTNNDNFATTPSLSRCNDLKCAYSTYSLTQTSASKINGGQTFTITFPAGTTFSNPISGTYNGSTITGGFNTSSPPTLTFTTPVVVNASTSFAIVLNYIYNQGGNGPYNISTSVPNSIGGTTTSPASSYPFSNSNCTGNVNTTFSTHTLSLSTTAGCTPGTYTFTQSIPSFYPASETAIIASGSTVTIVFNSTPAVDLSTATMAGSTFNGTAISSGWSVNNGTHTITFNTPTGIYCPGAFSIVIAGITNPTSTVSVTGSASVSIPNYSGGTDSYNSYSFTTTNCPVFLNTSATLCNNLACAKSTYTLTQTTGSATTEKILSGKTFTIVFPAGTDLSTLTSGTYNGTTISGGFTISGTTVTFTTPVTINANTTFSIVLSYIGNPTTVGTYYISTSVLNSGGINTTSPANSYSFTTASCTSNTSSNFTSASLALSTTVGCTPGTYTFTQTISGASSTIASGSTVTITFTGSPSVVLTTITSIKFNGTSIASGWTVSGSTLTFPAPASVTCPGAFSIVLNGITNPTSSSNVSGTASISIVNNTGGTDSHSSPLGFTTGTCCSVNGCSCPTNNSNGTCASCSSSTSGCTYSVSSGTDATAYTLNNGQTLCITGGTYTGVITFNGGKVVVGSGGTFNPSNSPINFPIKTGTIEIQSGGFATINGINSSIGNVTINNCGSLTFTADVRAAIGTFYLNNDGIISSNYDLRFSITGTLCNSGTASFNDMDLAISSNSLINNGTLNLSGNLTQSISNMTLCGGSTLKVAGNWRNSIGKTLGPGSSPNSCGGVSVGGTSSCGICTVTGYINFCDSSAIGKNPPVDQGGSSGTWGSTVTNCTCATVSSLPITLVSFEARPENNKRVKLDWITSSEINNDYFTIEKSADAVRFKAIAKVKGAGNSTEDREYELTDEDPIPGLSYYRLSQTDYDGRTVIYEPLAVQIKKSGVYVYPNPIVDKLQFFISSGSSTGENVLVEILDVSGKQVLVKEEHLSSGTNPFHYDAADLSAGIYILKVATSEGVIVNRFVK